MPYAYCEQIGKKIRDISDEIPFDIPESWEWSCIGNIAFVTKLAGFEYTKNIAPNLQSNGIPLFKGKNVQNGKLVYNFEGYIPESLSDELLRSQINKKCLLTPYVGTIGNIAIFPGNFKAHLGSNVGKIEIINSLVLEEYVMYFFRSDAGYKELTKYKKATAQESISIEAIRNAFIPIPPLSEQQRIVTKIEELLPYIEAYEQAETQLTVLNTSFPDMLKKSILQEAVQGKLVPQNPDDEPASVLLERIRAEKLELIKQGKIKKDKHESVIVTRDKIPYEIQDGKERCIADEVPFEIPESWCWCRFSSIINLQSGQDLTPDKYNSTGNGLPYITGASNIENGSVIINRWTEYGRAFAYRNDILLTCKGTVGTIAILKEDQVHIARQIMSIQPSTQVFTPYIKLVIETLVDKLKAAAKSMIPGIARDDVLLALVPLPPLSEQKRIVEKINELLPIINSISK